MNDSIIIKSLKTLLEEIASFSYDEGTCEYLVEQIRKIIGEEDENEVDDLDPDRVIHQEDFYL